MINAFFSAPPHYWNQYCEVIPNACRKIGIDLNLSRNLAPEVVDYIIYAPNETLTDFTPYSNCKAVLSLWAGVETIATNPILTQPLCRLVDPGLEQGMVEWVMGHVLRYHLGIDTYITAQDQEWRQNPAPIASSRHITVLGLGALGAACATALAGLGFNVTGWSRSAKSISNVNCLSGQSKLQIALSRADMIVLLLPLTSATMNILNAKTLSQTRQGVKIINPGRGALIDDSALLTALDSGWVDHATLDVFRTEPLPKTDPYWHHPRVTVTPHIASETRPDTAAQRIAENIKRGEFGEEFLNLVDRKRGY